MVAWVVASSMVYVLNDLLDHHEDKANALRIGRPLASGEVSRREAVGVLSFLTFLLLVILLLLPSSSWPMILGYLGLNLAYSLGLKKQMGLRQLLVALGFWLRLKSGASPVTPIILTAWASMFTLGLAYFLTTLKGFGAIPVDQGAKRWATGIGAAMAGALALTALTSLTLKRAAEGHLAFPEFPPALCLLGMHRFVFHCCLPENQQEQAMAIFKDPVLIGAMVLFGLLLGVA